MAREPAAIRTTLLSLALSALCTCCHDPAETPEIAPAAEAKTTDLVFKIARHDVRADGGQSLSVAGLLHGRPVGFDLELAPWRENPPGYVNISSWECTARWRSQGPPSDELLRFMDSLYATQLSPPRMAESVELQALSLGKNPRDFQAERIKLLLLLPSSIDDARDMPELWLDVDAKAARIHLREKEVRRRRAVVVALSASP